MIYTLHVGPTNTLERMVLRSRITYHGVSPVGFVTESMNGAKYIIITEALYANLWPYC